LDSFFSDKKEIIRELTKLNTDKRVHHHNILKFQNSTPDSKKLYFAARQNNKYGKQPFARIKLPCQG
jgi:hypothetical protein